MRNLDLACAAAGRAYAAADGKKEIVLAAATVLQQHGVYALFRYCENCKQAGAQLAEHSIKLLNDHGFGVAAAGHDACARVAGSISTDLAKTFAAHRLLTRFLDYAYIHARAREAAEEAKRRLGHAPQEATA